MTVRFKKLPQIKTECTCLNAAYWYDKKALSTNESSDDNGLIVQSQKSNTIHWLRIFADLIFESRFFAWYPVSAWWFWGTIRLVLICEERYSSLCWSAFGDGCAIYSAVVSVLSTSRNGGSKISQRKGHQPLRWLADLLKLHENREDLVGVVGHLGWPRAMQIPI